MIVKIWGSRAIAPVSGAEYKTFGSNTACIEVSTNSGTTIILDAGTGLGAYKRSKPDVQRPAICLSNLQLDHIQGFSLYPEAVSEAIAIFGPRPDQDTSLKSGLGRLYNGILLPDVFSSAQTKDLRELASGEKIQIGDAVITTLATRPDGSSLAWRISADGQTFVYCADSLPITDAASALLDFMADADLALVNGQSSNQGFEASQADYSFEEWPASWARGM